MNNVCPTKKVMAQRSAATCQGEMTEDLRIRKSLGILDIILNGFKYCCVALGCCINITK